jgi:RNA-directed DNA polymerase
VRFCDDFVICFKRKADAERVLAVLPKRLGKFGLQLHPDKTRLVDFRSWRSPCEKEEMTLPTTFNFLGYVFAKLMWWKALGRPPECRGPLLSAT